MKTEEKSRATNLSFEEQPTMISEYQDNYINASKSITRNFTLTNNSRHNEVMATNKYTFLLAFMKSPSPSSWNHQPIKNATSLIFIH